MKIHLLTFFALDLSDQKALHYLEEQVYFFPLDDKMVIMINKQKEGILIM